MPVLTGGHSHFRVISDCIPDQGVDSSQELIASSFRMKAAFPPPLLVLKAMILNMMVVFFATCGLYVLHCLSQVAERSFGIAIQH